MPIRIIKCRSISKNGHLSRQRLVRKSPSIPLFIIIALSQTSGVTRTCEFLQSYLSANRSDNYKQLINVQNVLVSRLCGSKSMYSNRSIKFAGYLNKFHCLVLRKSSIRIVLYFIMISLTDTSEILLACIMAFRGSAKSPDSKPTLPEGLGACTGIFYIQLRSFCTKFRRSSAPSYSSNSISGILSVFPSF